MYWPAALLPNFLWFVCRSSLHESSRSVLISFSLLLSLRILMRITNSHLSRVIQNTQRSLVKGEKAVILAVKIKFILWPLNFKWMKNNENRRTRTSFYIIFFIIILCDKITYFIVSHFIIVRIVFNITSLEIISRSLFLCKIEFI